MIGFAFDWIVSILIGARKNNGSPFFNEILISKSELAMCLLQWWRAVCVADQLGHSTRFNVCRFNPATTLKKEAHN
jgi:hypothetical protein